MRLYTPLDLRNIKDQYTRSAFRRLDQWLRDVAGNLSPSQGDSISQQVTNITQILSDTEVPEWMVFDDCQRDISGGSINIAAGPGEIPWIALLSTAPNGWTKDTTTFPQADHPGVWKSAPGGNVGEYAIISPISGTITTSQFSVCRPRGKFIVKIGAGITATTQRKHFLAGYGFYPSNPEFPGYFIGFVWWYVDQEYNGEAKTPSGPYTSLTLGNDPGAGAGRKDMFMAMVVDNNVATAQYVGAASSYAGLRDCKFIIQDGRVKFYVAGLQVADLPAPAVGSPIGGPLVAIRSRGTNNPGGERNVFLDYFGVREVVDLP